jgi:hypothetical protein
MRINTKVDFIIIGAQKAATTFLHRCLEDHPEVYLPNNEISYFENPDFDNTSYEKFINQFSEVEKHKIIGIKRPNYLHKEECPERIKNIFPNVKLIVTLRDPIARFISAYFHYIRFGFFPVIEINKAIPGLLNNLYANDWPRSEEIISFSKYHKHLEVYKKLFGKDQLLILNQESIKKDKKKVICQIYQFLNVDINHLSKNLESRPKASIYSTIRLKLLTKRNKYFFNYYYNKKRLTIRKMNKKEKIYTKIISGLDKYIISRVFPNNKPILTNENIDLLNNYFLNS